MSQWHPGAAARTRKPGMLASLLNHFGLAKMPISCLSCLLQAFGEAKPKIPEDSGAYSDLGIR